MLPELPAERGLLREPLCAQAPRLLLELLPPARRVGERRSKPPDASQLAGELRDRALAVGDEPLQHSLAAVELRPERTLPASRLVDQRAQLRFGRRSLGEQLADLGEEAGVKGLDISAHRPPELAKPAIRSKPLCRVRASRIQGSWTRW